MNVKRLTIIGLISFCLGLFIYSPAQLMGIVLHRFSENRLSLAYANGSFWQGNGHILLNNLDLNNPDQQGDSVDLGKLAWNTQIMQLLTGKIAAHLTWNQEVPFWVTVDSSRVHIEHATFNLPADIISTLVPSLKTAQLGGQIEVHCENFSLAKREILGQLEIDWNQASSPLSIINPLGNYHTKFEGKGESLALQLNTLSAGPLLIKGSGRWTENGGFHFEGIAEADPASKKQLQELLRVMGNETNAGSGKYQLRF